jgi:hypothetical protein
MGDVVGGTGPGSQVYSAGNNIAYHDMRAKPGASLQDCLSHALRLARALKVLVRWNHEGVAVVVGPESDVAKLAEEWEKRSNFPHTWQVGP